jgi:hypothetical protein
MNITCTITNEENDILESYLGGGIVQPWLQHCLDNKIRQRVDAAVLEYTDMNPKKMDKAAKMSKLSGVILKQREEVK